MTHNERLLSLTSPNRRLVVSQLEGQSQTARLRHRSLCHGPVTVDLTLES
jgi:hypothetical protein